MTLAIRTTSTACGSQLVFAGRLCVIKKELSHHSESSHTSQERSEDQAFLIEQYKHEERQGACAGRPGLKDMT